MKANYYQRKRSITNLYIIIILAVVFFNPICFPVFLYADDLLNMEVRRVADNSMVSNISFATQDISLTADDYYTAALQYIVLIYSYETNNTSWGIRLYTYNLNYTGSEPYGGAISYPVNNRRLPLLWRIYDSLQPGGVVCTNSDNWAEVKDRRDQEWNTAPGVYDIVSGAGKPGELAAYPVSSRTINSNVDLYVYLGANCSGAPAGTNNYDTTLYLDVYHELPPGLFVNRITPAEGYNSDRKAVVCIYGQGFKKGAKVQLLKKGQKTLKALYVKVKPTKIRAVFNLTRAYKTGAWDLKVTNPDKESITLPEAFMVRGYDMTGNKLIPVHNLFNPALGEKVKIKYCLAQNSKVSLKIYNIKGEVVKTLLENVQLDQGAYQQDWDGLNDSQQKISSGIYFIRIKAEDYEEIIKIALVR